MAGDATMDNKLLKDVMNEFFVPLLLASSCIGLLIYWPFAM